jgi:hypothetical protein
MKCLENKMNRWFVVKQDVLDKEKELEECLDILLVKQNYFDSKINFRNWNQYLNECVEYEKGD